MDPISIGILCALLGTTFGGIGGYLFGSAAKEARFKILQDQIAAQAKVIAEYERRLDELLHELEEIREHRSLIARFMWFVFKSDPKLYQAFAKMEAEEAARAAARNRMAA